MFQLAWGLRDAVVFMPRSVALLLHLVNIIIGLAVRKGDLSNFIYKQTEKMAEWLKAMVLLNRYTAKSRIGGSNHSLSATSDFLGLVVTSDGVTLTFASVFNTFFFQFSTPLIFSDRS